MINTLDHDESPGGVPVVIEWTIGCERCETTLAVADREISLNPADRIRMTHVIACQICDERIEVIMEALLDYGAHTHECPGDDDCLCGWRELKAALHSTQESVK